MFCSDQQMHKMVLPTSDGWEHTVLAPPPGPLSWSCLDGLDPLAVARGAEVGTGGSADCDSVAWASDVNWPKAA